MISISSFKRRFIYRKISFRFDDISAIHPLCAKAHLMRQKIIPAKLYEIPIPSFSHLFQKTLSQKKTTQLLEQLSLLLSRNIPLLSALRLIQETSPDFAIRATTEHMMHALHQGSTLTDALKNQCHRLTPPEIQLLHLGEEMGLILKMLKQILGYRKQTEKLSRSMYQACRYPALLIVFALLILGFLVMNIIPQFVSLYQQSNSSIPYTVQILLMLSDVLKTQGTYLISIVFFVALSFKYLYDHNPKFYASVCYFLFYCPFIAPFTKNFLLCKILKNLSISLNAHLPLSQALRFAQSSTQHPIFQKMFEQIILNIESGVSLYQAFGQSVCFNPHMLHLVRLAEQSGQIPEVFSELAALSEENLEAQMNLLLHYLQPCLLLIVGCFIALILIAIYTPILSLGQQL